MKRSNRGVVSAAAVLIGLGAWGIGGGALAQDSTYQPWPGATQAQASEKKLQSLVTELNALIKKAETANAADPTFLADLKKLSAKYPIGPAPGTVFLSDTFADGNYTANPVWKVSAGTWRVDTSGAKQGLSSQIGTSSSKVTTDDLLKAILGAQQQQQGSQATYASIYTVAPIANAFKMSMKLTSDSKGGPLNIGPYQGASANGGYRLVYQPGQSTGLILQRIVGNKVTQIGAYNGAVNLEDGKVHEITWSRDTAGKMRVLIDNQSLISVTDTQIQNNLDGWLNINQGGAYWIREIKVVAM